MDNLSELVDRADLKDVAQRVCERIKAMDVDDPSSMRRSAKARDLVRDGLSGNRSEFTASGREARLNVLRGNGVVRRAVIHADGDVCCDCPDSHKGYLCKHKRALAGIILLRL